MNKCGKCGREFELECDYYDHWDRCWGKLKSSRRTKN